MGRNADKRQRRREARVAQESQLRAARSAEAAVLSYANVGEPQVPWWAESLRREGFEDEGEPTLAAALFRISALLVTRPLSAGGDREALAPVARELARLLSVDTLSIHRLPSAAERHARDDEEGEGASEPESARAPDDESDDERATTADGERGGARMLERVAESARLASDDPLLRFHLDDPLVTAVLESGRPLRVDDPARDPRCAHAHGQRSHVGSLLLAPLSYQGEDRGLLVVSRKEVRGFYDADERRVELVAAALAQDLEQARKLREALVDPETGLMSRMALLEALPREVERARRYGTPLSVLMLHLDGLRAIADQYGIVVTRELMAEVGRRLPRVVRRADLTVRFGADVFLVLSPVGADEAARGCERLIEVASAEPFVAGDVRIPLSVSASTATLEDEDDDALSLLLRAEASLPLPVLTKAPRPEGTVDPADASGRRG